MPFWSVFGRSGKAWEGSSIVDDSCLDVIMLLQHMKLHFDRENTTTHR